MEGQRRRARAAGRLSDAERQAIADALRAGESQHSVAKRTGRGAATVNGIARAEGIAPERSALEKADAARKTRAEAAALFSEAVQLDGLRKLAGVVVERIDEANVARIKPIEMQQLATAYAILIDKWRLIEGEATSRTEVATEGARERLAARIDELAARRQQVAAGSSPS